MYIPIVPTSAKYWTVRKLLDTTARVIHMRQFNKILYSIHISNTCQKIPTLLKIYRISSGSDAIEGRFEKPGVDSSPCLR